MVNRLTCFHIATFVAAAVTLTLPASAQQPSASKPFSGGALAANAGAAAATAASSSPAASVQLPYTIGSGDVLGISVWKEKDLSSTVTVRPDGNISLPLIGEVTVTQLTPIQVEDVLKQRLESLVVQPRITVTVVEIHSRMVYITGEIARPGAYPLNAPLTVLQLIAEAGGLTEFASRKKIQLVRADATQKHLSVNYKNLTKIKTAGTNPQLYPGDTLVVQ